MNEMIERVARAITKYPDKPKEWDDYSPIAQEIFRTIARLAIEAMREPTEGMCERAFEADLSDYEDDALRYFADIWQEMIDAALKE